MQRSKLEEFLKKDLRAPLRQEDQARLESLLNGNPEAQHEWAEEARLNRLLRQLPDVPVPSNFTSLVVDAVEAERSATADRGRFRPRFWWRSWTWARGMAAAAFLFAGVISVQLYQFAQREQVARSVVAFTEGVPQQYFDVIAHFDEIRILPASLPSVAAQPRFDADLLAAVP